MAVAEKTFHEENVAVRDMAFWSTPLTDNITVTPEGFLCCHNVKIARTGIQWYQGKEISHKLPPTKRFKVYRLAEDVSAEETLKSIEGKPITDGHPANFVDPSNHHIYGKGHGQNVRFNGEFQETDLMIKDSHMIKQVMDGKREVSLGYYCGYVPYKDGFKQINIRVNHIAIVPNGRAGSQVRIVDSALTTGVKKPMNKFQKQARAIKAMADGGAELDDIAEFLETGSVKTTDAAPAATPAYDENFFMNIFKKAGITGKKTRDEEEEKKEEEKKAEDARIAAIVDARMKPVTDAIESLAKAIGSGKKPKKTVDTDSPESILAALLGKAEDTETDSRSKVLLALGLDEDEDKDKEKETEDEDEDDEDDKKAEDAALKQIEKLKPYIAKLPKVQRKAVIDELSKGLGRGKSKTNNYAGILNVINKKTQDSNQQVDWKNLGDKISKMHNPHRANERKQA